MGVWIITYAFKVLVIFNDVCSTADTDTNIKIDTRTVNVGERVEIECVVTGKPLQTVTWSRLEGPLPASATINDVFLVIPSVQVEDAGTYVCTAENILGVQQRVNLFVRARPIITGQADSLTVALGSNASLSCDIQGYPYPEISWYKRDGQMPREYTVENGDLEIPSVRPEDAGIYVCNAENIMGKNEHGIELVVGDLVPYFDQNPSSYISYPPMNDVYLDFDILLSLKPETTDGLVLYSSQYEAPSGDFVCFGLREGYPEFRFDVGAGPAIIQGNRTMALDRWHTVKLKRERTSGSMVINDQAEYSGVAPGTFQSLDLEQKTYLGGVPDYTRIPDAAGFSSGFVGSVSQLRIKDVDVNLGADAYDMHNVEPYNTCFHRQCLNGGRCIPSNTHNGYACICPQGFAGSRCEIRRERCYPGACGRDGRCHDLEKGSGFLCICPLGRFGPGCQSDVLIVNPMFNVSSFVSYPQVHSARFDISIDIEFKPISLEDGIILYSGQRENGSGNYFALAIKNGYLEFVYNDGSGPAILRSRNLLRAGEWTNVTATKQGQEETLIINAGEPVKGQSTREKKRFTYKKGVKSLQEEVKALKKVFDNNFGNVIQFKMLVDGIYDKAEQMKEDVTKQAELYTKFTRLYDIITPNLSALPSGYAETFDTIFHDDVITGLSSVNVSAIKLMQKTELINTNFLYLITNMTMASVLIANANILILTSGVIVRSKKEEREKKDELKKARNDLENAQSYIENAKLEMVTIQELLYRDVILPLKNFTAVSKSFESSLEQLYDYIIEVFTQPRPHTRSTKSVLSRLSKMLSEIQLVSNDNVEILKQGVNDAEVAKNMINLMVRRSKP